MIYSPYYPAMNFVNAHTWIPQYWTNLPQHNIACIELERERNYPNV